MCWFVCTQHYRFLNYITILNVSFVLLYCVSLAKPSAEVYCRYRFSYMRITTVSDIQAYIWRTAHRYSRY